MGKLLGGSRKGVEGGGGTCFLNLSPQLGRRSYRGFCVSGDSFRSLFFTINSRGFRNFRIDFRGFTVIGPFCQNLSGYTGSLAIRTRDFVKETRTMTDRHARKERLGSL